MGQPQSKQPASNWAEFIESHADQKVKSPKRPNEPGSHLLTYGNKPNTRVLVVSMNKQADEKLLDDGIHKGDMKKADKVEYFVVSLQDFVKNGQFMKDEFLKKVKYEYQPTLYVINQRSQTFEIREAIKVLVDNDLVNEELTESKDGNHFYEAMNIVVPEQEPVVRTFSVVSTDRGVKEDLSHLLKLNKATIPNHKNTRVLIVSGTHGDKRKDGQGNIDPVGGQSGLSRQCYLNNKFYRQDCATVGIVANPCHFVEHADGDEHAEGDFEQWKTPEFHRFDIRTVTPCVPPPPDSLLSDPDFDQMEFQVIDMATYHNRPELRGNINNTPGAAVKRCQEFVKDVVAYRPTVIFVAFCFSSNGDIALALRAEGVFSELILEHELRSITGDPHAKLDSSQRDVLTEMCQERVRHVVLAGLSGTGKTLLGCEAAKKEAAKLKKEHPEAAVEIYTVIWLGGEGTEGLAELFRNNFQGMSAFKVKHCTYTQLCNELGLNGDVYVYSSIEFIRAVCEAKDKANIKEHERNGGGQLYSVFMFDEAQIKGIKQTAIENVQDWTDLGKLECLSTVRTITCLQPLAGGVDGGARYTVKLPHSSDTGYPPSSFCSRLLTVGYRNSPSIRDFNNFYIDHIQYQYLARGTEFKIGPHTPSSPAATKGVEWIQCSRVEDIGKAARKAVEDCGKDNTVVLYNDDDDYEREQMKITAEKSTAYSVFRYRYYIGCEAKNIVCVTNSSIGPEGTTRAREKLVLVTGPGLGSSEDYLLSEAAASVHKYKRHSEWIRCAEDPCGWSGDGEAKFPLLEHNVFCYIQECEEKFGAMEGKCPKCGWELEWIRMNNINVSAVTAQILEYVGRDREPVGMAQAKVPLSTQSPYFQIEIIDPGLSCEIAIGLAGKDYPRNKFPGWIEGSIGYHADDGNIYVGSGEGEAFGPKCNKGDVMGCGVMFPCGSNSVEQQELTYKLLKEYESNSGVVGVWIEQEGKVIVFFTRNREIIGRKEIVLPEGGLFPIVGMKSCQEKVKVDLKPDYRSVFGAKKASVPSDRCVLV